MKGTLHVVVFAGWLAAAPALAQEGAPAAENPAHNELRAVRDGMVDAFQKKDIDRLVSFMTDDVVVTVQNAETMRGHEQIRKFHERMSEGDNRKVESLQSKFDVDDLSILYGDDTAIAFGNIDDHFKLKSGMEFDLHSRWTAALTKQNGAWKVAALHVSTNMFDNGVSNLLTRWAALKSGGIALAVGLAVGALVVAWRKRRTP